ncbi:MAG: hypothetical protein V1844_09980 [Pseudomonadota bacterium]
MKRFSDFATDEKPIDGDKVKIDDILNKEIEITAYRIKNSKFEERHHGKCVTIQFRLDNEQKIFFTGSEVIMNQIEKYKNEIPFVTIIKKKYKYYIFT